MIVIRNGWALAAIVRFIHHTDPKIQVLLTTWYYTEDINECAQGVSQCDPLVECINEMPGYSCGTYWKLLEHKSVASKKDFFCLIFFDQQYHRGI